MLILSFCVRAEFQQIPKCSEGRQPYIVGFAQSAQGNTRQVLPTLPSLL